jgi:hypothetical protein
MPRSRRELTRSEIAKVEQMAALAMRMPPSRAALKIGMAPGLERRPRTRWRAVKRWSAADAREHDPPLVGALYKAEHEVLGPSLGRRSSC